METGWKLPGSWQRHGPWAQGARGGGPRGAALEQRRLLLLECALMVLMMQLWLTVLLVQSMLLLLLLLPFQPRVATGGAHPIHYNKFVRMSGNLRV